VEISGGNGRALKGRVMVVTLSDEHITLDASIPAQEEKRFADRVWTVIAKNWTDPSANPPLDPKRVADRLAQRGACDEAVKIYDSSKTHVKRARTVAQAQVLDQSLKRLQACKAEIAYREALERDK